MTTTTRTADGDAVASFQRLGVALRADGSQNEEEGVLNPASARDRTGELVFFPRAVAHGNVSRVERCRSRWTGDHVTFERDGFALEPEAPYERRSTPGGYGCEDPRVTFVPELDRYLMAYCAFGPDGARVAIATSEDAWTWTRLGLIDFHGADGYGDKDAAFFPAIVTSPQGVPSFALLHRPTLHESVADGRGVIRQILDREPTERESISISYVPAALALQDIHALLDIAESVTAVAPDGPWGAVKIGSGTPPVRTSAGWMLLYHGIDLLPGQEDEARPAMQYRAGVLVLDAERPHVVRYRSPMPVFSPETPDEREGVVDDVVFPTAIDPRPELGDGVYDVYYGMGDSAIGRGRLVFDPAAIDRRP